MAADASYDRGDLAQRSAVEEDHVGAASIGRGRVDGTRIEARLAELCGPIRVHPNVLGVWNPNTDDVATAQPDLFVGIRLQRDAFRNRAKRLSVDTGSDDDGRPVARARNGAAHSCERLRSRAGVVVCAAGLIDVDRVRRDRKRAVGDDEA